MTYLKLFYVTYAGIMTLKNELHVRGIWQSPLFSDQAWSEEMKEKLAESGFVTVTCKIIDDKIDSQHTNVTLTYNEEVLLQKW